MELEEDISNKSITDGESEDDIGCYFLQPSSSPYNINEKIQQANLDLYQSEVDENGKSVKVKFKNELVSYEPDLTDDDVNSLESDQADTPENQYKTSIIHNSEFNIFDIVEEDDEIIEEIETDFNVDVKSTAIASPVPEETEENESEMVNEQNSEFLEEVNENQTIRITSNRSYTKKYKIRSYKTEVKCKNHCLDKLDFDLSTSIRKLNLNEKPSLPPLKLHQRKCCKLTEKNLPSYNGYKSEYGLSQLQLENRQKREEAIKHREQMRQQLLHEYKNRRMQQNEAVFCQWLKDVAARRKSQKISKLKAINKQQQCFTPSNTFSLSLKEKVMKERPKTANEILAGSSRKGNKGRQRPHTTHSCVFIEVPESVLRRGLHIGDLLVTNSNRLTKKVHILTFS